MSTWEKIIFRRLCLFWGHKMTMASLPDLSSHVATNDGKRTLLVAVWVVTAVELLSCYMSNYQAGDTLSASATRHHRDRPEQRDQREEWWVMSEEWGVRSEELHRESPDDWRAASCAWCGDGLSFTLPLSLSSSCGAWQCKSGRWRTDLAKHRDVTIKTYITDNWVTIEDRVHPYILIHHYNFVMKVCKTSISLIIDWNLKIK